MELRKEREIFLLATRRWDAVVEGIKAAITAEEKEDLLSGYLMELGDMAWEEMFRADLAIQCYKNSLENVICKHDPQSWQEALEESQAGIADLPMGEQLGVLLCSGYLVKCSCEGGSS